MFIILAVIVASTVALLFAGLREKGVVSIFSVTSSIEEREKIREINLDLSIFDDERLKSLKSYITLPIVVGESGRENPFAPF